MNKRKILKTLALLMIFLYTATRIEAAYTSYRMNKESLNKPLNIEGNMEENIEGSMEGSIEDIIGDGSRGNAEVDNSNNDNNDSTGNSMNDNTGNNGGNTGIDSGSDAAEMASTAPEETVAPITDGTELPIPSETATQTPEETESPTPEETSEPYAVETGTEETGNNETGTAETDNEETVTEETDAPEPEVTDTPVVSPYYTASQYGDPYVGGVLTNRKMSWSFNPNNDNQPPTAQREFDIRQFDGYYLGDIYKKVVYLTFDEGYENGYTPLILDALKEKGVKAAFFVTKTYIEGNRDLVIRMVNEGHIVANHSVKHKSSPDLSDEEFKYELEETARYFKEVTGVEMGMYFRPPMGEYSARTLQLAMNLGYKTVFWSFAYRDWLTDDQPTPQAAFNTITTRSHNGCIFLLHAVSEANTKALPDVIDYMKQIGYEFKSLDDL